MVEPDRITILKDVPPARKGRYVQYWMQQAMRAEGNSALDYAIETANELNLPVLVSFGLTGLTSKPYPDANARHYTFLLQGLAEVERTLSARGVAFVARGGSPVDVTLGLAEDAALIVCDRGYLRPQRSWHDEVVARAGCRIVRIETDAVVPIDIVSTKHEYAARTIRTKIERHWDRFLVDAPSPRLGQKASALGIASELDLSDVPKLVARLKVDHSIGAVQRFTGGLSEARAQLRVFLRRHFDGYSEGRSAPEHGAVSHLSPYFHFGQISPIEVALAARNAETGAREDRRSFLDELIVRRELAFNHCYFEPAYDRFAGLPDWARKTLAEHMGDPRPHSYSAAQLEAGDTHDRYFNGAMREMRETGYMHNRMRMYWGKKILEWSPAPEEAFDTTLALNNRYFLDGRDANSFTNVAWLFGLHDRPWFRRPVFGLVRAMGESTLRKFDADGYLASVDRLVAGEAR